MDPRNAAELRRPEQGRVLAGVSRGLAEHLQLPVLWVRGGFVALSLLSGFGALVYGGLWLSVPSVGRANQPVGLVAATRLGLRPGGADGWRSAWSTRSHLDTGLLVAFAAVGIGGVLLMDRATGGTLLWPLAVVAIGAAVVWRQAETTELRPAAVAARVALGVAVVALGLLVVVVDRGGLGSLLDATMALLVLLVGVAIVTGPWLLRLYRDLLDERQERVRSQERADVAAHLHDSVLQTLALIHRRAEEPDEVRRLARSQERDLRRWLYDSSGAAASGRQPSREAATPATAGGGRGGTPTATSSRAAARAPAAEPRPFREVVLDVAAEVEDSFGIDVDVVVVGDVPVRDGRRGTAELPQPAWTILAAVREALVNAGEHSGASEVAVYVEGERDRISAFVRDRGAGFDLEDVPADRHGVRGSIMARLFRAGGTAEVVTAAGGGTEVRMSVPLVAP